MPSSTELSPDLSIGLCTQIAAWRFEQLPASVVRMLKLLLIDVLAVTAGAARADGIATLNRRLARWERGGSATGLIGKRRYSPPSAALANGAAAHALDYDDIHDDARVHSGCVVLPALMATAEDSAPVTGRDFLLALAVGVEMHARLGLAGKGCLAIGWHPTMLFGSMGASLAAGRLLGLDAVRLRDALGIAFHQAGGSIQSAFDGVLTKRLGAGLAARDAVTSAFLAADGITGTRAALEGKAGFFNLHARGEVDLEPLTSGLGQTWRIEEYGFKPYPGCRCSHSAIGVAVSLHGEGVPVSDIAGIEIRMSEANWRLVGSAYDVRNASTVHAQFNAAYSFARALTDGRVGPASYDPPAISEPTVVELARRTRVIADSNIDPHAMEPVCVELTMRDGRRITRSGHAIKGSPRDPMTEQDVIDKLRDCLAYGLDAPRATADRLAEVALDLDNQADAAQALIECFPAPR